MSACFLSAPEGKPITSSEGTKRQLFVILNEVKDLLQRLRFLRFAQNDKLRLAYLPELEPRADLKADPARVHPLFTRQKLIVRLDKVVLAELHAGKDLSADAGGIA